MITNLTGKFLIFSSVVLLTIFCVSLFSLLFQASNAYSEDYRQKLFECSCIKDNEERLKCYDELTKNLPEPRTSDEPCESNQTLPPLNDGTETYLTKLWELDTNKPRGKYVIMPYRSNYILPLSYNNTPNAHPFQQTSSDEDVEETEVKFQISLKVKLWQDVLGKNMDLWFGYTQRSFWQLYDFADSAPFRETNYEPEVLLNYRTNFSILGLQCRFINMGFNHQSNGRSEPYSRSWNRIVANIGLEKNNFILLGKAWYRIPESADKDDNPDLEDYMGYGEIWGYYLWNNHRLGMMIRNNLNFSDNRNTFQFEWSFPLYEKINGYIQYFCGYEESLLDYNHSSNRIGIGLILNDWK